MKIENHPIGVNEKPFLIAEMSGNHNKSLEVALKIVEAVAKAGAQALKIQTFTPDTMTLDIKNGDFEISDISSPWHGRYLYDLYEEAHTPWEWHQPIFEKAKQLGLIAFSTPFDKTSIDFLESLNVPCYKIASFENTDFELLSAVASTGKPVIMSTGMTTLSELAESVEVLRGGGCKELVLLKCTSSYPASPLDSNLMTIKHMRELFGCEVGLSDHTRGIGVSVASVAFGASVIEKHFTLDRSQGGIDAEFSMEPAEMRQLSEEIIRAHEAIGSIQYDRAINEKKSMIFRRSIYVTRRVSRGERVTNDNVRTIRPGYGLEPKYLTFIMGKKFKEDCEAGTAFSWNMIDE